MLRQIAILILVIAILFTGASCQGFTGAATGTATAKPTDLPAATREVVSSPAITPAVDITFTPTAISPTSNPLPSCMTTYFVPIAFMPDNIRILVRVDSGIQIFNLQTLKTESIFSTPVNLSGPEIAMSPDGEMLAWALNDNTIQVIRMSDQELLHPLVGHTDAITKLKFTPNGDRLFSASRDTWVRIWDSVGNEVHAFQPTGADDFPSSVLGMGISPDGTKLATIPSDGPVKLWSLADYKLIKELGGSGGYDTSGIAFSPDGQLVAADLATGLFLWSVSNGEQLLDRNPAINSMQVVFSPSGSFLAYSETGDKNNITLSSPDGTLLIRSLEGYQDPIWKLIFSSDSTLLASASNTEIRIWRVEDGQPLFIGKNTNAKQKPAPPRILRIKQMAFREVAGLPS